MSDRELNEAIEVEVEGGTIGLAGTDWNTGEVRAFPVPDYCHDDTWMRRMIEKYKLGVIWDRDLKRWEVSYGNHEDRPWETDESLPRAVALAVLALRREGK